MGEVDGAQEEAWNTRLKWGFHTEGTGVQLLVLSEPGCGQVCAPQ